jgi:hypothetical protein
LVADAVAPIHEDAIRPAVEVKEIPAGLAALVACIADPKAVPATVGDDIARIGVAGLHYELAELLREIICSLRRHHAVSSWLAVIIR